AAATGTAKSSCIVNVAANGESLSVEVLPPLAFQTEVSNLKVNAPGVEVVVTGPPGHEQRSVRCTGTVSIRAAAMRFEVDRLQVGELGTPSTTDFFADRVINDERLRVEVHEKSTLVVGGAFQGRHAWEGIATLPPEPDSTDNVLNLPSDCERRLPEALAVVVYENYALTGDPRVEWARRYDDLFPQLLNSLVAHGLATTAPFSSRGDLRKMRVRPNLHWLALKEAYKNPGK